MDDYTLNAGSSSLKFCVYRRPAAEEWRLEARGQIAGSRVIVAQLGSGASLCAVKEGKSVDSTLGFTALDGLCMGTRD